jgi:rare lipoprotein A
MHSVPLPRLSLRALRALTLASVCLAALALAGCSGKRVDDGGYGSGSPGSSTGGQPRGSRPYTVMGQTYYPILDASGYSEEGVASWYGRDFHGKTTANGEIYDMRGMTAAHKILPFGTQLRVTNLDNGRSITVRVNDRGPFVANRVIDLTQTGAEKLDMIGPGTARVRLESVGAVAGQKGNDLMGRFYVQIGAFSVKENAHALAKKLQSRGQALRVVFVPDINFHRVQAGPYTSLTAAESAASAFQNEFPNNFIVAD